ncbi:MAG TPA: YeeE/YedE family protein [Alphaproteobacteria bacterium]|jgi:hypothetical protein|nr:YeeE/YedE family protein [Alphaproteobacteria bacterium]MDP6269503.1 YeeE/YedE family protein [Alphaproteobacteria bacterium]MDP7164347.1 YeeE/YedE family protein [Alphaproteobacteria bacterium]MDP7427066.1 YeeE/YedE family protein [Alphaproteobacteria bacterium]HJM51814.1 YeeE/YedE family protein [Alphaproteobacteria bacterium]
MDEIPVTTIVAAWGLALGAILGATVQRTNFCTIGAISDAVLMGSYNRLRAWLLAIATALVASQGLHGAGLVDLGKSIYLSPNLGWLGAILGGLLFGFGMTLAGGCGNRTLVRLGAGNLKSLVVALVMGVFAYMTLRGLLGLARVELEAATMIDLGAAGFSSQGIVELLAAASGLDDGVLRSGLTIVVAGALAWWCFKDAQFRRSPRHLAAGLIVGLTVPAGWLITGVIGNDEFDPVPLFSVTFVSSTADSVQYLMTFTGATVNFGVGLIGGVIAGALAAALLGREFRLEAFAGVEDMARHLIGAALMGVGGILALGCTIGQGITGMSTLALGSLLAWLAIMAGGVLGIRYLEEGSLAGILRVLLARN